MSSSSLQPKIDDYEATALAMEQVITTFETRVADLGVELVELQRDNEFLLERCLELLEENEEFTQQVIDLEAEIMALESLTSDVQSELDELKQVIEDHEVTALEVERLQVLLEALLAEAPFSAGDDSSASYRGYLDTWYHYVNMSTGEITPQYDAKLINGSWSLVDLGNGVCRLRMTWTELNINEEVEGAPPGTYDHFIVVIESQEFHAHGDMIMLYGDAHWLKIHWDGTVGGWTSVGVVVDIWPNYAYGPQFYYQHERYRAGVGLLIYGSIHHSPS